MFRGFIAMYKLQITVIQRQIICVRASKKLLDDTETICVRTQEFLERIQSKLGMSNECRMTINQNQRNICNSIFLSKNSEHSVSNNPLVFPQEMNSKKKNGKKVQIDVNKVAGRCIIIA